VSENFTRDRFNESLSKYYTKWVNTLSSVSSLILIYPHRFWMELSCPRNSFRQAVNQSEISGPKRLKLKEFGVNVFCKNWCRISLEQILNSLWSWWIFKEIWIKSWNFDSKLTLYFREVNQKKHVLFSKRVLISLFDEVLRMNSGFSTEISSKKHWKRFLAKRSQYQRG
jgi:hypothetical protein